MGAWIETNSFPSATNHLFVTPLVGAWIETKTKPTARMRRSWSHPMWVRGLKLERAVSHELLDTSHPMWVRGLKQPTEKNVLSIVLSHPMWVRGLKHARRKTIIPRCFVAPHVGAWIEPRQGRNTHRSRSHPMRVRGLNSRKDVSEIWLGLSTLSGTLLGSAFPI